MKTRVVSAVQNIGGCCRPAAYLPPGVVEKKYEQLCAEAGLPICVGSTYKPRKDRKGKGEIKMAKSHISEPLPALEDLDFLEAPFFDPTVIKSMLTQAGVGAAGDLALAFGLGKIDLNPHIKSAAALVATLGGARYLWDKQRDVAYGIVATSSFVLADWLAHILLDGTALEIHTPVKSYEVKFQITAPASAGQLAPPATPAAGVKGLDDDEDELFGLGQDDEDELPEAGLGVDQEDMFGSADVQEQRPLLDAGDVIEQRGLFGAEVEEQRSFQGLVSVLG